ncbi:MAG TPA: hypothetical protein IAB02_07055 [Candidatus Pullichristensenella excrementigallinarum]|uniref:VOC domain-containing protein n=1 Tax=Candidatus Pullichristensenella excrementigallinarum TaxID=2840907 RepID=A0A9D1IEB4_9FIRM|nr:hypothetical protein [Candidatus Pullichristensenella excrementigallinarum]
MKRIGSLIIALMLLFSGVQAFAREESGVEELLENLGALLDTREELYALQTDVYDAIEEFCQQNDYSSLLYAREICSLAILETQAMIEPTFELSDEAFSYLIESGIETDAVEAEMVSAALKVDEVGVSMMEFEDLLYSDVYQKSTVEILGRKVAVYREIYALDARYDGYFLNYLLIPLEDDPAVLDFWEGIPERWPHIGENLPEWGEDQGDLELRTIELFEEYEGYLDQNNQIVGEQELEKERLSALLQEGGEALQEQINVIKDMPEMLPYPEVWGQAALAQILLEDSASEGQNGSSMMIVNFDVSEEMYDAYIDVLIAGGAQVLAEEEEADERSTAFQAGPDGNAFITYYWGEEQQACLMYDSRQFSAEANWYIACLR